MHHWLQVVVIRRRLPDGRRHTGRQNAHSAVTDSACSVHPRAILIGTGQETLSYTLEKNPDQQAFVFTFTS